MQKKVFVLFSLMLVLVVLFSAATPAAAQPSQKVKGGSVQESYNGVYVVQMSDMPVVAYQGNIKGLKATAPKNGQKIDPTSADVINYVAYLNGKHDAALGKVGGQKLYDYVYSYNGFAAKMSVEQANKLTSVDGVLAVTGDELQTINTSSTPAFLGLAPAIVEILTRNGVPAAEIGPLNAAGPDVIGRDFPFANDMVAWFRGHDVHLLARSEPRGPEVRAAPSS